MGSFGLEENKVDDEEVRKMGNEKQIRVYKEEQIPKSNY